jgi:hypothetical protein
MKRLLCAALLLGLFASASGCAICSNAWDCAYGTYGGKWDRGDRFNGRVNSAFAPAGGMPSSGETIIEGHGSHEWVNEGSLEPSPEMNGR